MKLIKYILYEYLTTEEKQQVRRNPKLMDKIILEFARGIQEDEEGAEQAKAQGLVHLGGGYWSSTGQEPATHTTRDGPLRALTPDEIRNREKEREEKPEEPVLSKGKKKKNLPLSTYQRKTGRSASNRPQTDTSVLRKNPLENERQIIDNFEIHLDENVIPRIEKIHGSEVAKEFEMDMYIFLMAIGMGDQSKITELGEKYGLYYVSRTYEGEDVELIYTHKLEETVDGKVNNFGIRKPLGTSASQSLANLTALMRAKDLGLAEAWEVAPGSYRRKEYSPSYLGKPAEYLSSPTDVKADFERGIIRIGDMTIRKYDLNDPEIRSDPDKYGEALFINSQIDVMEENLFNDDGTVDGIVLQSDQAATVIARNFKISIQEDEGLAEERKRKAIQLLDNIMESSQENLDKNVSTLVSYLSTRDDTLRYSRSLVVESIAVLREANRDSTVIIPNAGNFPLGDFIVIRDGETTPLLNAITIDFNSVKFDGGAASSLLYKVALTQYRGSNYFESGNDVKDLLLRISSSDPDSNFQALWGDDPQEFERVEQEYDQMVYDNKDMILEYYGLEGDRNFERILEAWDMGYEPIIVDGKIDMQALRDKGPISPLLKTNRQTACKGDKLHKRRWKTFCRSGFFADILNNVHVQRQGFINTDFERDTGDIHETNGGAVSGEKAKYAATVFTPNTASQSNPCRPSGVYPTKMIPRNGSEVRRSAQNTMVGETKQLIRNLVVRELEKMKDGN